MDNFDEIIKGGKPTLVDFFATWCGPCKMQSPIIDEVKKSVGDDGVVLKVDVDGNRELAARYRVQSIPTIILFKDGEPVWRAVGLQQANVLETKMREYMPSNDAE